MFRVQLSLSPPATLKEAFVAADLFKPELVCYLNITDIREVVTDSKMGI
jgi:hypothetical protein